MRTLVILLFLCPTMIFAQSERKAKLYYNEAVEAYNAKEMDNAILYYTQAIKENPDYTKAFYNRGNILLNLK